MDLDRENLEVKIAYLESEQDKLERALNEHHERLYKAELLIDELAKRLRDQATKLDAFDIPVDEKPPHY